MAAFVFLAVKRQDKEHHAQFALMRLNEAEPKVVQKQLDRWEKEA